MKRKIPALILAMAVAATAISCGFSPSGSKGVTLTIMGKKTDLEKTYMTRIFDLYEENTGNRLKRIEIEDSEFERAAVEAFTKGDAPDILMHFNNSNLNNLDVSERFLYLNEESWVDGLTEGSKAYCQDSDGNILGLPFWESSVSGCYYNKTLLKSLGLKPASAQTEFDALCQGLADIGVTPICWPANGCSWMYQFGLDPVFADDPLLLEQLNNGQIQYSDIPAVADMVEWIERAAKKGWFGNSYLTTGWDDISSVMSSGKAAMLFIWDTWFYTDFEEGGKYSREDFALMPVFLNTAENGTYEGGNLNMMMVNKNGKQTKEALEFLAFCATPDYYNQAFEGISTVSCFKGQTTNVQSEMVTDAIYSIQANQRVSTAEPKIIGYDQDKTAAAFQALLEGKTDAAGCVSLMDESRLPR